MENTEPNYSEKAFKTYICLSACLIIGTFIYGIMHPNKFTTKEINNFYIIFLSIMVLPLIFYCIYLQYIRNNDYNCKCVL
jgi:hypothetical protein